MLPKPICDRAWIDVQLLPPGAFVTALVQLTMVRAAERHRKFVAHFTPERARLRKLQMVRIGWAATAGEAGLGTDELQVIPIPLPQYLADRSYAPLSLDLGCDALGSVARARGM